MRLTHLQQEWFLTQAYSHTAVVRSNYSFLLFTLSCFWQIRPDSKWLCLAFLIPHFEPPCQQHAILTALLSEEVPRLKKKKKSKVKLRDLLSENPKMITPQRILTRNPFDRISMCFEQTNHDYARAFVTPVLFELHKLPVKIRIEYKLATLSSRCFD